MIEMTWPRQIPYNTVLRSTVLKRSHPMKIRLFGAALLGVLIAPLAGALAVGEAAPELAIAKVIKGGEVRASLKDSGTIHVVEFWATWCGPCRQSIPHLTELQKKYKDKNVRIIGISDEAEAQVAGFVEKQGDAMEYTVALDKDRKTWEAFAVPFGVTGIPHAFVVDAAGTLLWHGHPMDGLDEVLAQAVDGSYDASAARELAAKDAMQAELGELTMLWAQEYLVRAKYGRDTASADKLGQQILESGYEDGVFYSQFAWTMLNSEGLKHRDLPYMLKVAEMANTLAKGESADILDTLALAQFRSGNAKEAIATQERAIALCTNDELMVQLKERLAQYQGN